MHDWKARIRSVFLDAGHALRRRAIVPPATAGPASGWVQDLQYGLRLLRSQPSYALLVIVTIALGIGATTTLFSVANGVLLKPLPWPDADRLVRVSEARGGKQGRVPNTIMNGTFLAWQEAPQTVEAIAAWRTASVTLNTGGHAERLEIASVSPNMFDMLRAKPVIGRTFAPSEASGPLQPAVAILSYGLWQERFGGRDDVLGSAVQLDGSSVTVVGVMAGEFVFPDSRTRAWTAWAIPTVDDGRGNRRGVILGALARLRPGVTARSVVES